MEQRFSPYHWSDKSLKGIIENRTWRYAWNYKDIPFNCTFSGVLILPMSAVYEVSLENKYLACSAEICFLYLIITGDISSKTSLLPL